MISEFAYRTVRAGQTWVELPGGWRLAGLQFSAYHGG